jgi:glucose/arabinose dehydrogenase
MQWVSAISIIVLLITIPIQFLCLHAADPSVLDSLQQYGNKPTINDPSLKVDMIFKGLQFPTSMAFLKPNDILVLEKNNGTVQRILNGKILDQPLLRVSVANKGERGLLGIAIAKNSTRNVTYVFLYYTQSGGGKTGDDGYDGVQPVGNRLYRYELINNKLSNPKLLLNLPTSPKTPNHNGGKIVIGPDQNVYLVVGDVDKFYNQYFDHLPLATEAQNIHNNKDPDGSGGILRLTQDGKPFQKDSSCIFGSNNYPLNLYYAYGIRNSFGLAFDPITGILWDTENGPDYGDEINLVQPGFNSGWGKVQGMWYNNGSHEGPAIHVLDPNTLVNLEGKGKYRSPELIWNETVAPTGLVFLNSTKLGKQYENDLFAGDFKNGNIYDFRLNPDRMGLSLYGRLADRVVSRPEGLEAQTLAKGFGGITDIKVGPDGYLYILSFHLGSGTIYRISHK